MLEPSLRCKGGCCEVRLLALAASSRIPFSPSKIIIELLSGTVYQLINIRVRPLVQEGSPDYGYRIGVRRSYC